MMTHGMIKKSAAKPSEERLFRLCHTTSQLNRTLGLERGNIMKNKFRITRLIIILVALLLSACGEDSSAPNLDDVNDIDCPEWSIGPEGGTIEIRTVTPYNSRFSGVSIVVPAGALDDCRSFSINPAWVSDVPVGCIADYHYQFSLTTGGDQPYDLELEFHFPVTDQSNVTGEGPYVVVGEGEFPCAFGYDSGAGTWNVILADSFDGTTMTVKTTYYNYWTWGKISLDHVSTENLIGAVQEQYGDSTWNWLVGGIGDAIEVLKTLYVDRTCPTWTRMRDVDLPYLIQTQENILLSYQSQLDTCQAQVDTCLGICGTCDLFSLDFGLDLSAYVLANLAILGADLWDAFFGDWTGFMPFLGDIQFFFALERICAIAFIEAQECDYSCVTRELGAGVYATYALHHVYLVTQFLVGLAIDNAFWVECP
jgi:hypothetical protein